MAFGHVGGFSLKDSHVYDARVYTGLGDCRLLNRFFLYHWHYYRGGSLSPAATCLYKTTLVSVLTVTRAGVQG